MGDIVLYRTWTWNTFTVNEFAKDGISVRVLSTDKTRSQLKNVPSIFAAIEEANSWIGAKEMQVKNCVITSIGHNEFRLYKNQPSLFLNYEKISPDKAAHEMSHAIFAYLQKWNREGALRIVDAFLKMKQTPTTKIPTRDPMGAKIILEICIGIWVADPTSWSDKSNREHPDENANEYFASLREGLVRNKDGVERAINKIADNDLKALLHQVNEFVLRLKTGKVTGDYIGKKADAEAVLAEIKGPADFQEDIDVAYDEKLLRFSCSPETFPGAKFDPTRSKMGPFNEPGIIDEVPGPPNPFLPKPLRNLFGGRAERERDAAKVHAAVENWKNDMARRGQTIDRSPEKIAIPVPVPPKVRDAVAGWRAQRNELEQGRREVAETEQVNPVPRRAVPAADWGTSRPSWFNRTPFSGFPTNRVVNTFPSHTFPVTQPYHPAYVATHPNYPMQGGYKPPAYVQATAIRPLGPTFDSHRAIDPFRGPLGQLGGQRSWSSGPGVEHFATGSRTWNAGGFAFSGLGGTTTMDLMHRSMVQDTWHHNAIDPRLHEWNHGNPLAHTLGT